MKKTILNIICLSMVVMLGLQANYVLVFYGLFELNRDALTEEVCEKKVEGCNACCYLNKQVNDEQNTKNNAEPVRKNATRDNINLSEYIVSYINLANSSSSSDWSRYSSFAASLPQSGYLNSIDHPPQV